MINKPKLLLENLKNGEDYSELTYEQGSVLKKILTSGKNVCLQLNMCQQTKIDSGVVKKPCGCWKVWVAQQ